MVNQGIYHNSFFIFNARRSFAMKMEDITHLLTVLQERIKFFHLLGVVVSEDRMELNEPESCI